MKLKSFGCSFIFGSELADEGKTGLPATGSRLTWPALLAKQWGYEYKTYSRPGAGNLQIAERALTVAASAEKHFYIIGWTWIDRFDYQKPGATIWPGKPWVTIMPGDNSELAEIYYRNLHSEYQDKLTSLMAVKNVIDTLKSKDLPFIMTYIDELMFDSTYNTSPAVKDLQDYVRPYMTQFNGMTFTNWSQHKGYPIGTNFHPLEQAHQAASEYILELGVHKV